MKRGWIALLVLVVIAAAVGGFWWWARTAPEQVVGFLASGGLQRERAEQFVALAGAQQRVEEEDVLVASGSIEGVEVAIVSLFDGRIAELHAAEGDEVRAGQPLVQLDTRLLEAQLAQAQAAVAAAEASLANVRAGAMPAEVLAAQAALAQAEAERDAAETAWHDAQAILENPQEIEAQIAQARSAVELARVQVERAEAQIASAEAERFQYRAQGTMEEKWLYRVYDFQVQAAHAALEAAKAERQAAQQRLAALRALRDNPLAIASQVHQAEARYAVAANGVEVAEAKLAELQAGPMPEAVDVAQAQVGQAQAGVDALQTQIAMLTLTTPISGVVTSRSAAAGEPALAGSILMTVSNLDEVKLTIYVPEAELGRVYLGQEVEVRVDAYPDRVFQGVVSYIAQEAEFTPRNVQTEEERVNMVFAVKVRLPNPERRLKPGMPADAYLRGDGPGG
ncbi:MAG: efflux RND transporter periplasmic adaptor subunit [Anaerolineae bacterium]|nr:efflux RND transporter periplasmic adaptor subunit [Anaerolineae bacterium]